MFLCSLTILFQISSEYRTQFQTNTSMVNEKWRKVRRKEFERKCKILKNWGSREEAHFLLKRKQINHQQFVKVKYSRLHYLHLEQLIANITANTLVVYVLIKTKQILQITCKLIFMLSMVDLLLGVFCQNLLFAMLFSTKCSVIETFLFLSAFLLNSSCYHVIRWH